MSSARTLRRAQERANKKKAKKIAATLNCAASAMPDACDECNAPFDKTNILDFGRNEEIIASTAEVPEPVVSKEVYILLSALTALSSSS